MIAEYSDVNEIIKKLEFLSDHEAVKGMAKFGINPEKCLGVSIPSLRQIAREIGKIIS